MSQINLTNIIGDSINQFDQVLNALNDSSTNKDCTTTKDITDISIHNTFNDQNSIDPISNHLNHSNYYWLYISRDKRSNQLNYWLFENEHQKMLNEAYDLGIKVVTLKSTNNSHHLNITIHLDRMIQTTNNGHSYRDILKLNLNDLNNYRIKGIAGQICDWHVILG